jgi:HEAT repeat protein
MNTRQALFILIAVVVLAAALGGGYLLWQRSQRPDLATLLAEVRAARSTPTAEGTPAPTPTPDANALADTLASGEVPYRLSIARTLAGRDDIPVERRAEMLVAALAAEVAAPSTEAPRIRDTYLSADGVLRLALVRGLAELGAEALPTVRQAAEGATGVAREHLLVARAYLGDAEAFPAVREVLRDSGDPVARMDAARALGVAGDAEAIPDLVGALEDPYRVEARDSLGAYTIYPVREQAVGALDTLGVAVERGAGDTFTVEGQ